MIWRYRNILAPKNHTKKMDKIHEDFELYQAIMSNFLYQTVPISPIYKSLTKRLDPFWSGPIETFRSGAIETF